MLAQQSSWGISIRTAISLSLKICTDITPRPGVVYWLTPTLCQPLSLSYFGCPCAPSRSRNFGAHESLFHPSLYDVEAVLHLRFLFVLREVKVLLFWG